MFLNDIFGLKVSASANVTAFEDIKSDFYTDALCKFYVVILNNEEPHFQRKNSTVKHIALLWYIFGNALPPLCGSRKYPYPHHGGNWKFRRGRGGVKSPGKSRGEGG